MVAKILPILLLLFACSPKYYCKRCPTKDSVVYNIDTIRLKGDTIKIGLDCDKDTIIVERQGRLEIRTVIKNRYIKVQGVCDSVSYFYITKNIKSTKTEYIKEVPILNKLLIGLLIVIILSLLYTLIRSFI